MSKIILCRAEGLGKGGLLVCDLAPVHRGCRGTEEEKHGGVKGQLEEKGLEIDIAVFGEQIYEVLHAVLDLDEILVSVRGKLRAEKLAGVLPRFAVLGKDTATQERLECPRAQTQIIICIFLNQPGKPERNKIIPAKLVESTASMLSGSMVSMPRDPRRCCSNVVPDSSVISRNSCSTRISREYESFWVNYQAEPIFSGSSPKSLGSTDSLWAHLGRIIQDCLRLVDKLDDIVLDICGQSGRATAGLRDAYGKVTRKKSKEDDLRQCRSQLSSTCASIIQRVVLLCRWKMQVER